MGAAQMGMGGVRTHVFVLDGIEHTFEFAIPIVLAAARQIGINVSHRRSRQLLWLADEALGEDYDEDTAEGLKLSTLTGTPLKSETADVYIALVSERLGRPSHSSSPVSSRRSSTRARRRRWRSYSSAIGGPLTRIVETIEAVGVREADEHGDGATMPDTHSGKRSVLDLGSAIDLTDDESDAAQASPRHRPPLSASMPRHPLGNSPMPPRRLFSPQGAPSSEPMTLLRPPPALLPSTSRHGGASAGRDKASASVYPESPGDDADACAGAPLPASGRGRDGGGLLAGTIRMPLSMLRSQA